jgi:hypothetical protein
VRSWQADLRREASTDGDEDERLDQLGKLGDLRDRGVLTEEEFAAEKARLLGGP